MHDSSQTHREIVAAVASLKSCLRSLILAVSPPASGAAPTNADSKIQGSIHRADDAVAKLEALLSAVADQTLRLPLETSTRLVDVGLPDLLQQLLSASALNAQWPRPACPAPCDTTNAAGAAAPGSDGTSGTSTASGTAGADNADAASQVSPSTVPAATHPSWEPVQQLLQAVFSTLAVLTSVLVRACTRSPDPAMVLMQLASPEVMKAQVEYLQQLKQHAAPTAVSTEPVAPITDTVAANSIKCAPACVAAFTSIYGLLAAATDAQAGLDDLRQQLVSSLCSTQLLPVAAELLLLVPSTLQHEQHQSHQVQADCQAAGWSLLTLALFMSGAGIAINPACAIPPSMQPGQPLPSSMLAASIRADSAEQPLDLAAAFAAAADPSVPALQEQLLSPSVLRFLLERLSHCVTELRGSYGSSGATLVHQQKLLRDAAAGHQQLLLPGRCCPVDQDVLHAALRALRCWRALLMGSAAASLPLVSSYGMQLLLTLLSGALAEPIRAGSSERAALRGRVIRVTVHCLQLLCSCLPREVLLQQLPVLTAALAGVVSTAGTYWDSNKRAVKSEALPYTGQVRCVDKPTGDMMVRYTMAAQSALDLLRQLLVTSQYEASSVLGGQGDSVACVMLSAGVLPALEQLFRQLPVVSPAHVTASAFLVELLPLCRSCEPTAGQLPLLATLRKFVVKAVGVPEPDGAAAISTATHITALLGALATPAHGVGRAATEDTLLQHAVVQLLPALQAYVSSVLAAPIPAPYSTLVSSCSVAATATALSTSGTPAADPARTHVLPVMLATCRQLAALACAAPQLQLGTVLLSTQLLSTVADILGSSYWQLPGFVAAASSSSGSGGRQSPCAVPWPNSAHSSINGPAASNELSMFSGEYAVQLSVQLLEDMLALGAGGAKQPGQPGEDDGGSPAAQTTGIHVSCSADCLCALKRVEGNEACRIGNPKCGMDGWCCCASPKACSDITPPLTPATGSTAAAGAAIPLSSLGMSASGIAEVQPSPQQLLLVLSGLLQSRLLSEVLRSMQQLSGSIDAAAVDLGASGKGSCWSRPASATGLTVNVPSRRGSIQRDARGGSPSGVSPKGYSPLGHSTPVGTALSSSLRSQNSATQSFLSTYMGEPPALGTGSGSNTGSGLRITGSGTSRFASTGSAAAGSSPRYDDGAFGLLRAGSSGSSINWTAGTSLLQEAGVRVVVHDSSSGFGSSPSLASLASPPAGSGCDALTFLSRDGLGGAAPEGGVRGSNAAGKVSAGNSTAKLRQRVETVMLAVAACTLALGDAGLLGAEPLRRASSASDAAAAPDSTPGSAGRPGSATLSTASSPTAVCGFGALGQSRLLPSGGSGPAAALYSNYLQGTSRPRNSLSGSGPYGAVNSEEILAGIRSCLAAAGVAAVLPDSARDTTAVGQKDAGAARVCLTHSAPEPLRAAQTDAVSPPVGAQTTAHPAQAAGDALSAEASNSDILFPVELGLAQLNIGAAPAADDAVVSAAPAAPPCTPATPGMLAPLLSASAVRADAAPLGIQYPRGLSADVLRRLQGALAAAGPLLAQHSSAAESEVLCPQVVRVQLQPRPLGCWNPSCTNMPGVSEAGAPSKPCTSCKVATFCSKGCEKKAWPEHIIACSRLAALGPATPGDSA